MPDIKSVQHGRFIFPEGSDNFESVRPEKPYVRGYDKFLGVVLKWLGKSFHLKGGNQHSEAWINKKSAIQFINHNLAKFSAAMPGEAVLNKPLSKKTSRAVIQKIFNDYLEIASSKVQDSVLPPPNTANPSIDWDSLYTLDRTQNKDEADQTQKNQERLQLENELMQLYQDFQLETGMSPSKLLEEFGKIHEERLKEITPQLLAAHFGVDIELVKEGIFDEQSKLNELALGACLQAAGILKPTAPEKSALIDLETVLKNALKIKHGFSDGQNSIISYSPWEEIPLKELLILSDKQFYDLEKDGNEYQYLFRELIQDCTMNTPFKGRYSDEDLKLFLDKCALLGLNTIKPEEIDSEEIDSIEELLLPEPPLVQLEGLIKTLCETPIERVPDIIQHHYPDLLNEEEIRYLWIGGLNKHFDKLDLQSQNRRHLAVHLWNALIDKGHVPTTCPASLINVAQSFELPLKRARRR